MSGIYSAWEIVTAVFIAVGIAVFSGVVKIICRKIIENINSKGE